MAQPCQIQPGFSFTKYPCAIDSSNELPIIVDKKTPVRAEVVNRQREAIIAIESELGINPSGTFSTIKARLDALDALIDSIDDVVGGGIGTLGSVKKDGSVVVNNATSINFIGSLVDVSAFGKQANITVNAVRELEAVKEDNVTISNNVSSLNFSGTGVSVLDEGSQATISINPVLSGDVTGAIGSNTVINLTGTGGIVTSAADINMQDNFINNLADAVAQQDAVNLRTMDAAINAVDSELQRIIDLRRFGAFSCREAISTGTVSVNGLTLTVPLAEDPGIGIDGYLAIYGAGIAHGLSTPAAPILVLTGATGTTQYRYSTIAMNRNGGCSAIGATTEVLDAPDTITFTNYYSVQPAAVVGASAYLIVRETWNGSSYDSPILIGKVSANLTTPQWDDFDVENWSGSLPDPVDVLAGFSGRNNFARRKVVDREVSGGNVVFTLASATDTTNLAVRVRGDNSQAFADAEAAKAGDESVMLSLPPGYYPCITGDLDTDPVVKNSTTIFFELSNDDGLDISFFDWIPHHLPAVEQVGDPNDDRGIVGVPANARRLQINLNIRCNLRAGCAITASNGGADTWTNIHAVFGNILDSKISIESTMLPMVLSELTADVDIHGITSTNNERYIVVHGYGGSAHSQAILTNGGGTLFLDVDGKGPPGTPWEDGIRDHSHVWRTNDPTNAQFVRVVDQQWYGGGLNTVGAPGKSSLLLGAETAPVSDINVDVLILERNYVANIGWPGVNQLATRFSFGNIYISRTPIIFESIIGLTINSIDNVIDPFIGGGAVQPKLLGCQHVHIGGGVSRGKWDLRNHSPTNQELENVYVHTVGDADSGANISSAGKNVVLDMDIWAEGGGAPYALQAFGGTISDLVIRGTYRGTSNRGLIENDVSNVNFGQIKILGVTYESESSSGTIRTLIDLGSGNGDLYIEGSRFKIDDESGVWNIVEHDGASTGKIVLRNLQLERPGSDAINLLSSASNQNAFDTLEASEVYRGGTGSILTVPVLLSDPIVTVTELTENVDGPGFSILAGELFRISSVLRVSSDASRTIRGFVAAGIGTKIRKKIVNVGANDVVLAHEDAGVFTNDRFLIPGSADLTIQPQDSVDVLYDITSNRWRVV